MSPLRASASPVTHDPVTEDKGEDTDRERDRGKDKDKDKDVDKNVSVTFSSSTSSPSAKEVAHICLSPSTGLSELDTNTRRFCRYFFLS